MKKNIIVMVFVVFISLAFSGFVGIAQETSTDSELDYVADLGDDTAMNWTKKVLRVKGNGFGPERVKELGRRKILAKRAAKMDAYRNLVEVIKGVHVTSNTRVEDMMLESDSIKASTEGMLKGMRVVNVTYSSDGGCEITVEVNIDEKGGFLLSALNAEEINVKDDYPKFDWVAMQKELKNTKRELSRATSDLSRTKRNLKSKRNELAETRKELGEIKTQYAALKEDFDKTRDKLITANLGLVRTEEKLKYTNLRQEDLKAAFRDTKDELEKTKIIVARLRDTMHDKTLKLAVSDKELAMTKVYLDEKKNELDRLSREFEQYGKKYENAILDRAKLQGYVLRIKDIQTKTGRRLAPFYKKKEVKPEPISSADYTGLLVDARGLNVKPVLAPSILNERKEKLYGVGVIPTSPTSGAIVDYLSGDIYKAKKYPKIGDEPLVIKASKVINSADVMIGEEDVRKLALITNLLEQQKVAILL